MNPTRLVLAGFRCTATADELVLVARPMAEVVGFVWLWLPEKQIHNLFVSPQRAMTSAPWCSSRSPCQRLKDPIVWLGGARTPGSDRKSGYLGMEWPQGPLLLRASRVPRLATDIRDALHR